MEPDRSPRPWRHAPRRLSDYLNCVSAPKRDPSPNRAQSIQIAHKDASLVGSRSAPIGTLPSVTFSLLHRLRRVRRMCRPTTFCALRRLRASRTGQLLRAQRSWGSAAPSSAMSSRVLAHDHIARSRQLREDSHCQADGTAPHDEHAFSKAPRRRPGQQRVGLGHPHQRRTDDRAAHAGARSPVEKLLLGRLEVGQQTNTEPTTRKRGPKGRRSAARVATAQRTFTQSHRAFVLSPRGLASLQASPQLSSSLPSSSGGLD